MPTEDLKTTAPYRRIHDVVRQIPPGKVSTYGQVAKIVGKCTARMAGYAIAAVPSDSNIPWHRVINSRGKISPRSCGDGHIRQYRLLEAEGIRFDTEGRVDLNEFRWRGQCKKYLKTDALCHDLLQNIEMPLSIHHTNGGEL